MAQKTKPCFLLTSPEKFPPEDGSGSSNLVYRTPTGSSTPAILHPKTDSSLPTGIPSTSPLDDTLDQMEDKEYVNGDFGEDDKDMLEFWDTRIRKIDRAF